jgi:predicted Ser/Thr protein kinase
MEEKLGKYLIRGILGKGAMGTVYDALDPVIDRRVAIKTLTLPDADDAEAQDELARFKREAQAAGRLAHPNIVGVFDYGETATVAYIVMEFVDGLSLKGLLDKKDSFPASQTVRVMEEMLAGLQFSHERGVVHRDIKPANIMLTSSGQVKIADFGIARIESSSMTQAGTIMGTPAYMSPEQFMGQTVDARTDLYSAGVVMYQMLTGERPFEGSMTAIMHKALNTVPPRPSELSVTAPSNLDAVVAKAMGRRPEQRYASAAEFAATLRQAFEGKAGTMPQGAAPQGAADDGDATVVSTPSIALGAGPLTAAPQKPAVQRAAAPAPRRNVALLAGVGVAVLLAGGGGAYVLLAPSAPKTEVVAVTSTQPSIFAPPTQLPDAPSNPPTTVRDQATELPMVPALAMPTLAVVQPTIAQLPVVQPILQVPTPPVQTAMVVPSPTALHAALAAAIASPGCSLLNAEVTDQGNVVVGGIVQRGAEAQLRNSLAGAASGANLEWLASGFDGPYCRVLDAVRSAARRTPGRPELEVALKGNLPRLRNNDSIVPRLTMPDFPAYLEITYFASDGTMAHLQPSPQVKQIDLRLADGRTQAVRPATVQEAARQFPARAVVTLGDPATSGIRPEEIGWTVAEPFGRDLLLVVASSTPLFAGPRPGEEPSDAYLRDLQAAMDAVSRKGGTVTARVMLVELVP